MEWNNAADRVAEISFLFSTDRQVRKLNRQYRKKDKATDVLSFAHWEGKKMPVTESLLGDIVISLDTAQRQARVFKVSLNEEILRLLVHGILHLAGYEHEKVSASKARRMFAKQAELVEQLRCHVGRLSRMI